MSDVGTEGSDVRLTGTMLTGWDGELRMLAEAETRGPVAISYGHEPGIVSRGFRCP